MEKTKEREAGLKDVELVWVFDAPVERVWIADIHQDGRTLFPWKGFENEKGTGKTLGTKRNFSLPPHSGDRELMNALYGTLEMIREAKPEMIILQAGADGIRGDLLTGLQYSVEAHSRFVKEVMNSADKICDGKLVIFGGGGYNVENCKHAWSNVLDIMLR